LQLTNILRDLDEDAAVGRLYLPREAPEDAGIAARDRRRCWPIRRWTAPRRGRGARPRHFAAAGAIIARCPAAPPHPG
jgi:phytoene synthase